MLRHLAILAALAGWLQLSGPAQAADTFKLGMTVGAPTLTLGLEKNDAETQLVWHHGFYRGGYGGFYGRSFYGGGFGRGFYGGFYPRFAYGPSYYYPRYSSFSFGYNFSRPYYYAAPAYYYSAPSFYYSSPWCSPIGLSGRVAATLEVPLPMPNQLPPATQQQFPSTQQPPLAPELQPMQPVEPRQPVPGTYDYDGGPQNPVPLPRNGVQENPTRVLPRPTVPLEGRPVSLPAKNAKYSYPAYGEKPGKSVPVPQDPTPTYRVSTPVKR